MTPDPLSVSTLPVQADPRWLRRARVVAELCDLAFAARRLHLSQTALRSGLRSLEAACGVTLFDGHGPKAKLLPNALERLLQRIGEAEPTPRP
ncbi:MAG: LysR family transcriptional regulator [Burkholderiaceae bacterium]